MASFLNFLEEAASSILGGGSTSAYFTLSCTGDSVTMPVSPASFDVEDKYNHTILNINAVGDVKMLGKRGLKTLTFSSFFPAQDYTFLLTTADTDPYTSCAKIEKMAEAGQPSQISISGTSVSMPVVIDSFTYGEHDGGGDVYFSISLGEYRYIMLAAPNATNDATGLKSRVATADKTDSVTMISARDTMDTAAKAVQKYTSIYQQQKRRIDLYRAMVKSGAVDIGTVLKTAKSAVKINDKDLIKW